MEQKRKRWRELEASEIIFLKALQRGAFDSVDAENDGIKLSDDGSLVHIGKPVYIDAGSVEEFAEALTEAFPTKKIEKIQCFNYNKEDNDGFSIGIFVFIMVIIIIIFYGNFFVDVY